MEKQCIVYGFHRLYRNNFTFIYFFSHFLLSQSTFLRKIELLDQLRKFSEYLILCKTFQRKKVKKEMKQCIVMVPQTYRNNFTLFTFFSHFLSHSQLSQENRAFQTVKKIFIEYSSIYCANFFFQPNKGRWKVYQFMFPQTFIEIFFFTLFTFFSLFSSTVNFLQKKKKQSFRLVKRKFYRSIHINTVQTFFFFSRKK